MAARRWQTQQHDNNDNDDTDDKKGDTPAASAERRREGVCLVLCVLAVATVCVCFGVAAVASSEPTARAEALLARIRAASAVEVSVAFKADDTGSRRVRRALYDPTVVRVHGTLFPQTSEDTGRLRFDGWLHVETNASERHELTLANHRGYRTVRALPSLALVREGCLHAGDIPPLHATEAIASTAFWAGELSAFGVNCSSREAIEVLFMGVPFVHCVDRPVVRLGDTLSSVLSAADARETATEADSTLVFHGERVRVEAVATVGGDTAAHWRERATTVPATCAYLEAPLTSGQEKRSLLYRLLPPR